VLYEMLTGRQAFEGETTVDVIDAILNREPPPLVRLNARVPPDLEHIVRRALEKDRDVRYQSAAEMRAELTGVLRAETQAHHAPSAARPAAPRARAWRFVALASLTLAGLVLAAYFFAPRTPALGRDDELIVADIENTTADPVFDDALKQALIVQLRQSPYLSIVSDDRIRETLGYMKRAPADGIPEPVAREICQRQHVKAVLSGSIAMVGSQYAVGLKATNCENGELLASDIAQAARKEEVLATVGRLTSSLRSRLGESLATLKQYDVAIVQATTPSLDALKEYTTGFRLVQAGQQTASLAHLERAVTLDPQFAIAWAQLATTHFNLRNIPEARRASERAYALRDRVTERERFYIDARYLQSVLGDLDATAVVYERWAQIYPRDYVPRVNLGVVHALLGDSKKAVADYEDARRVDPAPTLTLSNMAFEKFLLGQTADGVTLANQALAITGTNATARTMLLRAACQTGDDSELARLLTEARRHNEEVVLHAAFACAAGRGRWKDARAFEAEFAESKSRITVSHHVEHQLMIASSEWWLGNAATATALARATDGLVPDTELALFASASFAVVGEVGKARRIVAAVTKDTPRSTLMTAMIGPLALGISAWQEHRPDAAVELLKKVGLRADLDPQLHLYLGLAHEQAGHRAEAIASFHEGLKYVQSLPPAGEWAKPMLLLSLARASAAAGDTAGARQAYDQFLAIWAGADADAPLLLQVKREYAALK